MANDPVADALFRQALAELDPQAGDDDLSYIDILWRVQGALISLISTGTLVPTAAQETVVRRAVGFLDPHNDDAQQSYTTIARRLQVEVDRELSRWTSASVQPAGPSGETAVSRNPL